MHIPALITDLAVMMLTAGIIAIIFKRIKQPLVLGYILAGFLLSPYFPWFANIVDTSSIETWSEIGIIFLMFHLGLEFNMHKLAEVGSTAIITCIVDVVGMLGLGVLTGSILGFSNTDSIVLGSMLAMSSTMVIIKVFDEKGIKEKYTTGVFGTLVMQDIVGIFMMVILSTLAVSKNVSGMEVAGKLIIMLLYLVVWLVLGIYLLPTFLDRTIKYMNDEMLMVLSIGICFGMVLLANALGFSSALGAFLSGSLLAGTVHVERIEHLTKGIKDLFGAVFFISVGMMVDPDMIIKYIVPIIVIVFVTIVGKVLFNALGMILSGQDLETSVKSGFALAQIGEFAFIIANLGNSLGVVHKYLYPIAVAVSVITIFTTPICINLATPFTKWLLTILPDSLITKLTPESEDDDVQSQSDWSAYLKRYFIRVVVFGGLMFVISFLSIKFVEPFISETISEAFGKPITLAIVIASILIFAFPLLNPHSNLFTALWLKKKSYRLPLTVLNAFKILIILVCASLPVISLYSIKVGWIALPLIVVLIAIAKRGLTATWYLQIETRFLKNFNERLIANEEHVGHKQKWLDEALYIMSFFAPENADYLGKSLEKLEWGKKYNVYVVKIKKGSNLEKQYLLPAYNLTIDAGDKVFLVGEKIALDNFYKLTGLVKNKPLRTLKQFMGTEYPDVNHALAICPIRIKGDESFSGKAIKQCGIRDSKHVAILGLQKDGLPIVMPDPNLLLQKDDILWVMGSNKYVGLLISDYVDEAE